MTASAALLDVARLGVPIATLGHTARILKKKKKGVKDIVGSGMGVIIGSGFTTAIN